MIEKFVPGYLLIAVPISVLLGLVLGKFVLPLLQTLVLFPVFGILLMREAWGQALRTACIWALCNALAVGFLSYLQPAVLQDTIILGQEYQQEMFGWIETGVGKEGDVTQFLPEHLLHAGVFSIVTALSGGFLGLIMGSVLLNYMSFYVGTLLTFADNLPVTLVLAWPPWALVRVLAFILIACPLSGILWCRLSNRKPQWKDFKRFLFIGVSLLVVDIVLKWCLASFWQNWLKNLVTL